MVDVLNHSRSATNEARDYLEDRLGRAERQETSAFTIPVIDIASSYSSSLADREAVAKQIREACVSSGFFYVKSHNISSEIAKGILAYSKRFFRGLKPDQKKALHLDNSKYGYGWEPADATSIYGDVEQKEGFNWGYENDLDLEAGPEHEHVHLDGSKGGDVNQWPTEEVLPGFRDAVKAYSQQALQLARHICRLLALSLELPEDYFDPMVTDPSANGRLMYYPASARRDSGAPASEAAIGLGAHSDYQCFTILLCSSTPGLEVLSPAGAWIKAPAIEDALIVNIGDMMMRWTNGLYKSTVHRVINTSSEERYSVPLFFGVNNDQLVEVSIRHFPSFHHEC